MESLGVHKEKLKQKSQTTKFAEKNLQLVQVLNAMLGFLPHQKAVFKYKGQEIELQAVFDSQDWNPTEEKQAVFEFVEKTEGASHAD